MRNFYIGQYSTLPELRYSISESFLRQNSIDENMLRYAVATFSLIHSENNVFRVANSPAQFEINTEPFKISEQGKYVLKYRFKRIDTSESGKFFGEFKLDILHPNHIGRLTFPSTERINVFITPSITKTNLTTDGIIIKAV